MNSILLFLSSTFSGCSWSSFGESWKIIDSNGLEGINILNLQWKKRPSDENRDVFDFFLAKQADFLISYFVNLVTLHGRLNSSDLALEVIDFQITSKGIRS
jgi:hypothetical protein